MVSREVKFVINLSVVSFLTYLGFSLVSPILPKYALSFNVSIALTGWVVSAFAVARTLTDVPAGLMSDRLGKKTVMVPGLVVLSVSALFAGAAQSFEALLIGRALMGFGSSLYGTAASSWLGEVTIGKSRGRLMGVYSGMVLLGVSFGPAFGGFLAEVFGLRAPFYLYSLLVLLGMFATMALPGLKQTKDGFRRSFTVSDVSKILSNRSFLIVSYASSSLFTLRMGVRATLIPLYGGLNLSLNEAEIGIVLTGAAVASALVVFPSGWFSDRVGRKRPMMLSLLTVGLISLLIPYTTTFTSLLTVALLYGVAEGFQGPVFAYAVDVSPQDKLGTAMGLNSIITDIGTVVGPVLATYISEAYNPTIVTPFPFFAMTLIAIFAAILLLGAADPARLRAR